MRQLMPQPARRTHGHGPGRLVYVCGTRARSEIAVERSPDADAADRYLVLLYLRERLPERMATIGHLSAKSDHGPTPPGHPSRDSSRRPIPPRRFIMPTHSASPLHHADPFLLAASSRLADPLTPRSRGKATRRAHPYDAPLRHAMNQR